jgi:hypothetical protein
MDPSAGSAVGNGVGVVVNLAAGTMQSATDSVTATSTYQRFGVSNGSDTLRSIEGVNGTQFDDVYDATGFGSTSTNAGSLGKYNLFMPSAGNDSITGNGATELDYLNVYTSMNADLAAGLVWGDVQTGLDTITGGVFAISGGQADDVLLGGGPGRTAEPALRTLHR